MAVISTRVEDPRDRLDKATRYELWQFAQANGVTEIKREMPAMLMRPILRRRGLTNINITPRQLGMTNGASIANNATVAADQTDAMADLAKQWQQEQAKKETANNFDGMHINDLKTLAKSRGIKLSRKDTKEDLKAKLNGQVPA